MKHPVRILTLALPFALLIVGCRGEEAGDSARTGDMTRQRIGRAQSSLPPALAAKLDSGNAAYRADDYRRALELYRSATDEDPEAAAPWFGVYMAYSALGRQDSARAALERAGSLSESSGAFHGPDPHDTTGDVPNPHDSGGMADPHRGTDTAGDDGEPRP